MGFSCHSLLLEDTACASQAKGRLTPWQRSSLKLPAGTLPTVMGIHFLPPLLSPLPPPPRQPLSCRVVSLNEQRGPLKSQSSVPVPATQAPGSVLSVPVCTLCEATLCLLDFVYIVKRNCLKSLVSFCLFHGFWGGALVRTSKSSVSSCKCTHLGGGADGSFLWPATIFISSWLPFLHEKHLRKSVLWSLGSQRTQTLSHSNTEEPLLSLFN